jgi:hypothetical protein
MNVANVTVLTANSSGLTYLPTGNVNINIGGTSANLTMNLLTANGIKFPATQVTSADGNTLDDYEEGTWTPTVTASSSNPTVTYLTQTGLYTKVGRMVSIQGRVQISAISGGSGNFRLSGLPFTNNANIAGAGTSWFSGVNLSSGYTQGSLYFDGNNAYLSFAESGDNVGASQMLIGAFGNSFDIAYSFTYTT